MGKDAVQQALPEALPDSGGFGGLGGIDFGGSQSASGILGLILILVGAVIALALVVLFIIAWWKIYAKAGRPGWAIFVPVYSSVEFFTVTWGNGAYFLFMLVPGINVLLAILTVQKLSEAFGHGFGYTLGLIFFPYVFIPILAFGKAKHLRYQASLASKIPNVPGIPNVPVPEIPLP